MVIITTQFIHEAREGQQERTEPNRVEDRARRRCLACVVRADLQARGDHAKTFEGEQVNVGQETVAAVFCQEVEGDGEEDGIEDQLRNGEACCAVDGHRIFFKDIVGIDDPAAR